MVFMRLKAKDKGITLLEIIISLAILSIIVIPISSMALSTTKINVESEYKLKGLALAQEVMEYIKDPAHSTQDINNKITEINTNNTEYSVIANVESIENEPDYEELVVEIEIDKDNFISFSEKVGGNFNSNKHAGIIDSTPFNIDLDYQGNKKARLDIWQSNDMDKGNSKNHGQIDVRETSENIIITINLKGSNPREINLINYTDDKKLIVYTLGSSEGEVNIKTTGNVVMNPKDGGFYRVRIEVFNKGDNEGKVPLQTLEGYKIIYN